MAEKDFQVSTGLEVDEYVISPSGALNGQTLIYDGTEYIPTDIVPVGTIEMWAGDDDNVPIGWLLCDGSSYSWSQYTRLREVLGISYGGSENTSWNVPDFTPSTYNTRVTPIGLAAGGSRGNTTTSFATGQTTHVHNVTSQYSSNATNEQAHSHNVDGVGTHAHFLNSSNHNHNHNAGVPNATHSHNYIRGNTSNNTTNTNHGAHNTSNNVHNHKHTSPTTNPAHSHSLNANTANTHSHTWGVGGAVSGSGSGNHQHTMHKQSIYFIIKY